MFESCKNSASLDNNFSMSWSISKVGFGQYQFKQVDIDGVSTTVCENECMTKRSIRKVLDILVDNCVLLDEIDITNDTVVEIIKFDKNTLMTLVKLHDGRYVIGANVHIDDNMKHIDHVDCTNIDDAINTFDNYVMRFGQLVDNSKKLVDE
jgi:hypothetical protein